MLIARQVPIQLADQHLGLDHVLLRAAGLEPLAGDRAEVLEDRAGVRQDLRGLLVGIEVVIRALHGGDGVELGGGQLGQGDLHVLLGHLAAQAERAEPGELLREREVIGVVPHDRILRCDARDGEHRVRRDRVFEGRHLGDAILERLDIVIGGLDRPVLGHRPADIRIDRLRTVQIGGHRRGGRRRQGMTSGEPGRFDVPETAGPGLLSRFADHRCGLDSSRRVATSDRTEGQGTPEAEVLQSMHVRPPSTRGRSAQRITPTRRPPPFLSANTVVPIWRNIPIAAISHQADFPPK